MRLRSTFLIAASALTVGLPASAVAAPRDPVLGAADGVQAAQDGKDVVIHFTGHAADDLGDSLKTVGAEVVCEAHPVTRLRLAADRVTDLTSTTPEVDDTGTTLRLANTRGDVCEVRWPGREVFSPPLARVAVTPAGTAWIDALAHAGRLFDALGAIRPTTVYRPAAAVVADGAGQIVALDGPAALPPPDQVGYWTDGGRRAAFTTLTGAGRPLVIEDLGNGMLRTNVSEFQLSYFPPGADDTTINAASDADGLRVQVPTYGAPVSARDGLRASIAGGRLTVRFTGRSAATLREAAGRRVSVLCAEPVADVLFGSADEDLAGAFDQEIVRAPRRGTVLRVHVRNAADLCSIEDDGERLATVAATARGRRWQAETVASDELIDAIGARGIAAAGATAYPSTAAVVARRPGLVALSGPDAPVARGKVGVWTDGAQHALLARRLPSGVRGVYADDGNGVVRTNLLSPSAQVATILLGPTSASAP
jgi:hypothetical protein